MGSNSSKNRNVGVTNEGGSYYTVEELICREVVEAIRLAAANDNDRQRLFAIAMINTMPFEKKYTLNDKVYEVDRNKLYELMKRDLVEKFRAKSADNLIAGLITHNERPCPILHDIEIHDIESGTITPITPITAQVFLRNLPLVEIMDNLVERAENNQLENHERLKLDLQKFARLVDSNIKGGVNELDKKGIKQAYFFVNGEKRHLCSEDKVADFYSKVDKYKSITPPSNSPAVDSSKASTFRSQEEHSR